jgi:hypothetical protein
MGERKPEALSVTDVRDREVADTGPMQNDCALTQRTNDSPLLLLETLPGLRYRNREKHQDKAAALSYFRNLVEAHATDTLDSTTVRDIIGLEPGYTPLFEHSLRVVPPEQLVDIIFDKPLGKGENGAVYSAKWRKPPGQLATTNDGDRELDVVLKEVLPREGSSQDPVKKLLKEVRNIVPYLLCLLIRTSLMLHMQAWVALQ